LTSFSGQIGTEENSLDVGVNPDGMITAVADKGVYLNGPSGVSFNIASVTSGGDIGLSAAYGMNILGSVIGQGRVSLVSGGRLALSSDADIHAYMRGVLMRAGALVMEDNGVAAARIRSDLGTIGIVTDGDALISSIESGNDGVHNMDGVASSISIESLGGSILDAGDSRLDIIANAGAGTTVALKAANQVGGNNALDVQLRNLESSSGGDTNVNEEDSVNVISVDAGGSITLNAGTAGSGSITGKSVSSSGGAIELTANNGDVNLERIFGIQNVKVSSDTGITLGFVRVGRYMTLAGPRIDAYVYGGSRFVNGSITNLGGGMASEVSLSLIGSGVFQFDNFRTREADVNIQGGATLSIPNAIISDRATFDNEQTFVLLDQHSKNIKNADIQLYSGGNPFSMSLSGNRLRTNASIIYRDEQHEVITPTGTDISALEQSEDSLRSSNLATPSLEREDTLKPSTEELINFTGIPISYEPGAQKDSAK
jgi:hypothetical protein